MNRVPKSRDEFYHTFEINYLMMKAKMFYIWLWRSSFNSAVKQAII